jgi:uncharacterized RDD family membrane protein YckC
VHAVAGPSGLDVARQLETALVGAAGTDAAERALDGVLAGPLPERIGRSLARNRVVERTLVAALEGDELERALVEALSGERARRLLDDVLGDPAFERVLERVFASPAVRAALADQSISVAAETAAAARRRAAGLDDAAERALRRPERPAPVPFAGIATRTAAFAVDGAATALALLVGTALAGLAASLVGGNLQPAWLAGALVGGAWMLLEGVYFVGFWTTTGQTPGMRLLRVHVASRAGSPPGLARSLLRLVGLALAIVPCFAGFLPILVDRRRRGLHDRLAGTVVVHDERGARRDAGGASRREEAHPAEPPAPVGAQPPSSGTARRSA